MLDFEHQLALDEEPVVVFGGFEVGADRLLDVVLPQHRNLAAIFEQRIREGALNDDVVVEILIAKHRRVTGEAAVFAEVLQLKTKCLELRGRHAARALEFDRGVALPILHGTPFLFGFERRRAR